MTTYSKLTLSLIAVWFIAALAAAGMHWIETPPNVPALHLAIAVLLPLVLFAGWYALSPSFRNFCMGLDRGYLTLIHTLRVEGFVFLVLCTYHILPGAFARPAGWGDIFIGLTAPFVAFYWSDSTHKAAFVVWQTLGVLDLVTALTLGSTVGLLHPEGIQTGAMTVLPMSLIPTFGVPLFLILHFICLVQSFRNVAYSQVKTLPSLAASRS
jgi:hypothetical protein